MPTCRALAKGTTAQFAFRAAALEALGPDTTRSDSLEQRLFDQFASLATTIQTRMEASAGTNGSFGGSVEVQVQRAVAEVLRSPGSGSVAVMTPGAATGLGGPVLTPEQNLLLQEAKPLVEVALPAIARLQPIVPNQRAESDIELYRAILTIELEWLLRELGRPEGPRPSLVRVLLGGLLGWPADPESADVNQLSLLLLGVLQVPTIAQEEVRVALELLEAGANGVLEAWLRYGRDVPTSVLWRDDIGPTDIPAPARRSLADRLIRAAEIAPGISRSAALAGNALEAIGFSDGERHMYVLELETLVDVDAIDANDRLVRRVVTVSDILDWATTLAAETPRLTSAAGQLGLNLLADQADELFWLIEAIYGDTSFELRDRRFVRNRIVPSELNDAQVQRELVNLARDLDQLAELACATPPPGGTSVRKGTAA